MAVESARIHSSKMPNTETLRAMAEAERMASDPDHHPYNTFEDMMNALDRVREDNPRQNDREGNHPLVY